LIQCGDVLFIQGWKKTHSTVVPGGIFFEANSEEKRELRKKQFGKRQTSYYPNRFLPFQRLFGMGSKKRNLTPIQLWGVATFYVVFFGVGYVYPMMTGNKLLDIIVSRKKSENDGCAPTLEQLRE